MKTDMERYGIDEDFYWKRYRHPSVAEELIPDEEWESPYFTEEYERGMHLLDAYPGLEKFPVLAQEISWLDYQYSWPHEVIAQKLNADEDDVKQWLARRDSECQPVQREVIECDEDDIPF